MIKHYLPSITVGVIGLSSSLSAHGAAFLDSASLAQSEIFAEDARFQSVGMLRRQLGGQWFENGSGILIAPDWVLTAAHVITNIQSNGFDSIRFSLGHDGFNPTDEAVGDQFFIHPGYTGAITSGPDLGLIHLTLPVLSVTPATRFRGTDPQPGDATYSMAGYGRPGVLGGPLDDDTIKRAGSNVVYFPFTSFVGHMVILFSASSPSYLEWNGTPGDSGGGWFLDAGGESELAAVSSWASNSYSDHGSTGAVRLSLYNDWIDQTMQTAPEPSSAILLISGAFLCLGRRPLRTNEPMA